MVTGNVINQDFIGAALIDDASVIIVNQSTLPGGNVPDQRKDVTITETSLTVARLFVWQHDLNKTLSSVLILDNVGQEWDLPYDILSDTSIRVDFSGISPLVGNWKLVVSIA